jgi:hypothetical protein
VANTCRFVCDFDVLICMKLTTPDIELKLTFRRLSFKNAIAIVR